MTYAARPPGASVLGAHGPVVIVTGPAAAFIDELRRSTPLDVLERLKKKHGERWHLIAPELTAVSVVAAHWQQTQTPTRHASARVHDITPPSEEIGTGTAAGLLGVDVRTVQRMVQDGRLPARKEGGRWLIPRSAVTRRVMRRHGGQEDAATRSGSGR